MFVHFNNKVINADLIEWVDFKNLTEYGYIKVYCRDSSGETVEGPEAINLLMQLCPQALEGQQLKYERYAWSVHNLIGHPLMQIFSWLGLTSLGLKIHDATVPNPITK